MTPRVEITLVFQLLENMVQCFQAIGFQIDSTCTSYTEVGFHGRDVDQIIRDLMDNAMTLMRTKLRRQHAKQVEELIEAKILDFVCGESANEETKATFRKLYREGQLDNRHVEVELPDSVGGNGRAVQA